MRSLFCGLKIEVTDQSVEVFANNITLTMLAYLTYVPTLCFNEEEIVSCAWDTSVFNM